MARNVAIVITDRSGAERAVHRVQYGARLKVDEGDKVKRGQRLAEWDPFTLPIITERAGKVEYIDLIDSITLMERMDEVTGLTSKVVVDYKQGSKSIELRPRLQFSFSPRQNTLSGASSLIDCQGQSGSPLKLL